MSNLRESRRSARARERAQRDEERARDPVGYRAREAMDQLRDLLAEPWWTAGAATYIFAGLHPELTAGEPTGHWGPAWLPGSRDAYAPRSDRFQHGKEIESVLDGLAEVFTGEARAPIDWLKRAEKLGIEPPWLALALQDEACSAHMPKAWRDRADDIVSGWKRGERGAAMRWRDDPVHSTLDSIGERLFAEWFEKTAVNGKIPWGAKKTFVIDARRSGFTFNEGSLKNRLTEWIKEAEAKFIDRQNHHANAR